MKKILVGVIALVLAFSASVMAKETELNNRWNHFIETAEVEYGQFDGKFEANGFLELFTTDDWTRIGNAYIVHDYLLRYGIFDNVEIGGYYDCWNVNLYQNEFDVETSKIHGGYIKVVGIEAHSYKVSFKGYINHLNTTYDSYEDPYNETVHGPFKRLTGGFSVFYDQKVTDKLTLYNNYSMTIAKSSVEHYLVNGLQFHSGRHAFKAYFDTSLENFNFTSNSISAAYKTEIPEQNVVYSLEATKPLNSKYYEVINRIDYQVSPTAMTSLEFEINSSADPKFEVDLEKEVGIFTFKTGLEQTIPDKYIGMTGIKAGMEINLFSHLNLSFDAKKTFGIYEGQTVLHGITGFAQLSYDFN